MAASPKRRRPATRKDAYMSPVPWRVPARTIRLAIAWAARKVARVQLVASALEAAAVDFRVSDSFDTRALLVSGLGPGVVLETPARPASRPSWTCLYPASCHHDCQRVAICHRQFSGDDRWL